jgi:hypothetical protein
MVSTRETELINTLRLYASRVFWDARLAPKGYYAYEEDKGEAARAVLKKYKLG